MFASSYLVHTHHTITQRLPDSWKISRRHRKVSVLPTAHRWYWTCAFGIVRDIFLRLLGMSGTISYRGGPKSSKSPLLLHILLPSSFYAISNTSATALGVFSNLLKHGCILQHVGQNHKPDLASSKEHLLQCRRFAVSMGHRKIIDFAVHVVLTLRQEASISFSRDSFHGDSMPFCFVQ